MSTKSLTFAPRVAVTLAATFAAGVLSLAASCAHRPIAAAPYAQGLVRDIVARHPELRGVELAGVRGEGCVTVAATDAGDVGDRCDGDERRMLGRDEPSVQEPTRGDPVYVVTERLRDSSGGVIGLLVTDIAADANTDRAAAIARAQAIRHEMEARILSVERLTSGAIDAPPIDTAYAPRLDARMFAAAVTNPYFPLVPGTTYRFRGTGASRDETTVVTVTHDTRIVMGIRATVVHDVVFDAGEMIEDTWDWYGQDALGNVWYLGEDTKEYRNGRVTSTKGSWEAGVGGARPGIVMWADPAAHIGTAYRQEYLPGVAEDMGKVVSVRERVTVAHGRFSGCVRTEDSTPLEPTLRERKYYCRGLGVVKEVESATEGSELVAVERP